MASLIVDKNIPMQGFELEKLVRFIDSFQKHPFITIENICADILKSKEWVAFTELERATIVLLMVGKLRLNK